MFALETLIISHLFFGLWNFKSEIKFPKMVIQSLFTKLKKIYIYLFFALLKKSQIFLTKQVTKLPQRNT